VSTTRRGAKFAALVVGLSLIAAACGGDDEETTTATEAPATTEATEATEAPATTEAGGETTEAPGTTEAPAEEAAMRITYDLAEAAVWDDGTPITAADFECTYNAIMGTVGSLSTVGYDQILSIGAGETDKQVIVEFKTVYAPYRGLFGGGTLLKADAFADCNDISGDLQTEFTFSNRPYKMESWSDSQSVLVPNENYWGDDKAVTPKIVIVPKADQETEIASLLASEVDFIYPQYSPETADAVAGDANVAVSIQFGGDYEALYFQQQEGPFADPVFRQAFAQSIDIEALFQQIYVPIVDGATPLTCGPIVPGRYCDETTFQDTYDAEGAAALLEENGWVKDGDGFWSKDGETPEIRWMVNAGNSRRENTQAYLIPLLQAAGFNVVADNCEAECVFQQRLPSLDYDLGMYISTAPPDPQYLTSSFTCDQIPTEENEFAGQNSQGWCNEEASAALLEADATVDLDARAELIKGAIAKMREDWVLLPTFQFPKSGLYRTDKVGGPVEGDLNNYSAFLNINEWTDVDGDGQIVIGAEQWPGCLNPITECANSSWYVWTVAFPLLMGVYDTTNEGEYELTPLMASEPVVEVL
jgi:peptide/nickel transport system substrate-binding protein